MAFRGTGQDNNNDIYEFFLESRELKRLTHQPGADLFARWAPTGELTFVSTRDNESRIWRASLDDGDHPEPLSGPGMSYHAWAPTGDRLYAIGVQGREDDIWELLADGTERIAAKLAGGRRGHIGTEAFATDGRYLYFTWEDDLGDIWVMDVAWE